MAQWTILVLSLCGVLHGQGIRPPTVPECCQDGRTRASRGQDCSVLPLISSSQTCRISQEQCCAAAAEDDLCDSGVAVGLATGECEQAFVRSEPCRSLVSKRCCDCCLLGLMEAKRGSSCEFQGLTLGGLCADTAKTCCSRSTADEATAVTEPPQASAAAHPPMEPDSCRASNCSQLCVGRGTCACRDGHRLREDGVTCEDVNECLTGSHDCVLGQVCINTPGSFRCQREVGCGTGYELWDDNSCQDIDECSTGLHNCGPDFTCTNTEGSFRCLPKQTCSAGVTQDAVGTCIDINECVVLPSPCPPVHACVNTAGSYACRRNVVTCGRGYRLTEDATRCEDVDECRERNTCGDHSCVNLVGSHRCECRTGFIFNSITKLCEDINECRYYPGRLCAHRCENTEGSYRCSCTTGFKLSSDGRNCEDVNECDDQPCSQECANVYGSFQCYCRRGYQLSDADGITCEDIDECALPAGGHVCSHRCANSPGSFHCTCPPSGYMLAPNGRTCQDVDECAAGVHTCSASETCFNVHGGFRCLSFKCPPNFRQAAHGNDAPVSVRCVKACQSDDVSCALNPVHLITHSFLSLPTFRDFTQPEEIVFLRTTAGANASPLSASSDVLFDILSADDQLSFDVVKRLHHGTIMGVVRQVKPIIGPQDLVLEVALNYLKSGVISHRNVVIVHVFVSEFWW